MNTGESLNDDPNPIETFDTLPQDAIAEPVTSGVESCETPV